MTQPVKFGLNVDPDTGGDRERQSRLFAEQVVPAVRARTKP